MDKIVTNFQKIRRPSKLYKTISKTALCLFVSIAVIIPVLQIVLSMGQILDTHVQGFTGWSICEQSTYNGHRPFRVDYSFVDKANYTVFKVCASGLKYNVEPSFQQKTRVVISRILPSKVKKTFSFLNAADLEKKVMNSKLRDDPTNKEIVQVFCFFPPISSVNGQQNMSLFCSWNLLSTLKRMGIQLFLLLTPIAPIVWCLKDWIVVGICYGLIALIAALGAVFVFVTDAFEVVTSLFFCIFEFQNNLCNPSTYPYPNFPSQNCSCNYWGFLFVLAIDFALVVVWVLMIAFVIQRFYDSYFLFFYEEIQLNPKILFFCFSLIHPILRYVVYVLYDPRKNDIRGTYYNLDATTHQVMDNKVKKILADYEN